MSSVFPIIHPVLVCYWEDIVSSLVCRHWRVFSVCWWNLQEGPLREHAAGLRVLLSTRLLLWQQPSRVHWQVLRCTLQNGTLNIYPKNKCSKSFVHSCEGWAVSQMLPNRLMLVLVSSPSDVNECHDESLCTNGQCVNTEGSFYCNCNRPWTPDSNKKKCVMATIAGERPITLTADTAFI